MIRNLLSKSTKVKNILGSKKLELGSIIKLVTYQNKQHKKLNPKRGDDLYKVLNPILKWPRIRI